MLLRIVLIILLTASSASAHFWMPKGSSSSGVTDHGVLTGLADDDHTQYVLKSTYDAQTILSATTDNTPIALTITEQTLLGRITGGNIAPLSTTQVRTLLNVADGADVTNSTSVNAAGAVMESDYDATTFLYATSDNTPQPKTPAEVVTILGITSYTPDAPFVESVKTADYAVTIANDAGKLFLANKSTADLAFTLGDGTASKKMIYFARTHGTWGATITVANGVFIGGVEHTLLTLTSRFTIIGLMWNATYSKWHVFTGAGDVIGTTP